MSVATSFQSSLAPSLNSSTGGFKSDTFQDLPFVDRVTRLTVIELRNSDQQVVNELVYRWCRILTRFKPRQNVTTTTNIENKRALIIDLTSSISLTRLAAVLKEDYTRMNMIEMVRGCKSNSTYITLSSYLSNHANLSKSIKLIVIYQDEFYILKTLTLLKESLKTMKCKILLVVPKLDRCERDVLNLISNYQILKCDFVTKRREIGPALGDNYDSYQASLNKVFFQRMPQNITVCGHLKIDGLHKNESDDSDHQPSLKKFKGDLNQSFSESIV